MDGQLTDLNETIMNNIDLQVIEINHDFVIHNTDQSVYKELVKRLFQGGFSELGKDTGLPGDHDSYTLSNGQGAQIIVIWNEEELSIGVGIRNATSSDLRRVRDATERAILVSPDAERTNVLEVMFPGIKFRDFPGTDGADDSYEAVMVTDYKQALLFASAVGRVESHDLDLTQIAKATYPLLMSSNQCEIYGHHRFDMMSLDDIIAALKKDLAFYENLKGSTNA